MKVIDNEGIRIKLSYEYSFQKNAAFKFTINEKVVIQKEIVLPKFRIIE